MLQNWYAEQVQMQAAIEAANPQPKGTVLGYFAMLALSIVVFMFVAGPGFFKLLALLR